MALIESGLTTSGWTIYAIIRNSTSQVWNGSGFESYNASNWTNYDVALAEQGASRYYAVAFPGSISAGRYGYTIHRQVGGSPAVTDPMVDRGTIDTTDVATGVASIVSKLPAGTISSFDPTVSNVNLAASQAGVTIGTVNTLGTTAQANVKSQIDTALGTDLLAELTGVPSSAPTIKAALMFLFMALRNKRTSDATTVKIYNSAGSNITTAQQSDNGTQYTKENFS